MFGKEDKILQEMKIMRILRHENLMGVVDYWESSKEYCMVMEHIEVRLCGRRLKRPRRHVLVISTKQTHTTK